MKEVIVMDANPLKLVAPRSPGLNAKTLVSLVAPVVMEDNDNGESKEKDKNIKNLLAEYGAIDPADMEVEQGVEQPILVKRGRGRPPGSKTKDRMQSAAQNKLVQLNHDPIEKLVIINRKIDYQLRVMEHIRDCEIKAEAAGRKHVTKNGVRFSPVAYMELLSLQERLNANLMRYKYARVPETVKLDTEDLPLFQINLTTNQPLEKDITNDQ